jgi:hypothetical protein
MLIAQQTSQNDAEVVITVEKGMSWPLPSNPILPVTMVDENNLSVLLSSNTERISSSKPMFAKWERP